jgi:hypothetical protein
MPGMEEALPAPFPSEPGQQAAAPFRTKGLVFQGACDFYDRFIPGGTRAVIASAARSNPSLPGLERSLSQSFVAGGWYDVLPILPMSRAAAFLGGLTHLRLLRDNAAWLARRDLHGVYKVVLQLASVEMVAMRLPRLSMRYFDFGSSSGKMSGPKQMTSQRTGIPRSMGDWFVHCTEGFVPVALTLAGAQDVRVRCVTAPTPARRGGQELVDITVELSWS